jgi:dipeptidyl aminopeptidase/acylaminoacyl peptidase
MQLTHLNSTTATPRGSPDGQNVVFDSRSSGNLDLFVIDSRGGVLHRLTNESSLDAVPSWSRDGRWIYYASDRSGGWEVWKMSSTGDAAVQVTRRGGFAAFESPDGKYLYYAKGSGVSGLWRIPVNGGEELEVIHWLETGYWGYWAVVRRWHLLPRCDHENWDRVLRLYDSPDYARVRSRESSGQGSARAGRLCGQKDNSLCAIRCVRQRHYSRGELSLTHSVAFTLIFNSKLAFESSPVQLRYRCVPRVK